MPHKKQKSNSLKLGKIAGLCALGILGVIGGFFLNSSENNRAFAQSESEKNYGTSLDSCVQDLMNDEGPYRDFLVGQAMMQDV